jgi:DNA primase
VIGMGGLIPDQLIQDIRDRTNLVELISERTALRKRGRNWVGLCPFHAENTPSFTVNDERGFFHCFGCGASGNVFAWLMRTDQLSFPEAVRTLADRVGVDVPTTPGSRRDQRADDPLFQANEETAACYRKALGHAEYGAPARPYVDQRGIDATISERFGLGYAPASGDVLARWLRARRVPVEAALAVGVLGRRNDGSLFERFRGRLVFPIRDSAGRVVGFGGRVLPGAAADLPKYLNSPESSVFKKRQVLYGLREAREAIGKRDRAVLVEGYFDVIVLHQHGVELAVAPLGTAVTSDQLRQLRRHAGDVVACFDGDAAGIRAASRSFAAFVEAGLWARAALLPPGEDPDSFIRAHGRTAFEQILDKAQPLLDVFLGTILDPGEPSVARRVQAAREIGQLLRRVRNPWEYDVLARRAAERLGVREEHLRGEGAPKHGKTSTQTAAVGRRTGGEAMLIELMLTGTDAVERVAREGGAALFDDPDWRSMAEEILGDGAGAGSTAMLVERLPDEMRARVATALLAEDPQSGDRSQLLTDCVEFIRRARGRRRSRELLEQIRAAEAAGDEPRMREGLEQWRAHVAAGDADSDGGATSGRAPE